MHIKSFFKKSLLFGPSNVSYFNLYDLYLTPAFQKSKCCDVRKTLVYKPIC